ncbi:MAG: DNA repair protein RecO [Alphaproteobacteria bacterium 65-37]|jgi:DNA repair protein RecO (recombination protein O)|nr:DNA repair protein RecO [Alphaproteobacteria bacterium]OJU32117.1 MAG: DNA repair protein RecO [Alphaproteobacteria bacterium 65-37]
MDWSDEAIVLSARPHGESGLVVSLLTREHGRHAGFVPGGISRRARPVWQSGNLVEVAWRARLSEQLGNYTGELRQAYAAQVLDNAVELSGLAAGCALIDAALPEREPHPPIFDGFRAFLGVLGHPGWAAIYVRLELGLLQELGFGLDLEKCAATGATEDLAYVSPRTGRAVSRAAAGPYKEKLLPLPGFLSTGGLPDDDEALRQGLELTGYFLERHVFWPQNKPLPPARSRFMESLQR